MKIAFLTPEYPHAFTGNSGGLGTSIKNLAVGLVAAGCSVRVLLYGQKEDATFEDEGICIQQIKNIKCKGLSWYFTRKKIERIIDELHTKQEIDLVEAPDWTGITSFIRPKKCPIVIKLNGSDTYFCHLDQRPVKWINKFHEKRALENANALLSVSQFTADTTNAVFGLHKNFAIIPNCIDSCAFHATNNEHLNHNTILYFGSLIRKKGLLELPFIFNEVIQKSPETKLILVGKDVPDISSGNESTWKMMQELFTPEALAKVTYLGAVPYQEIQSHIISATVCVFPTFAEALPVSWIEAMAMGKAIVASNIGWATAVIDDGINGYLVHPTQHSDYANRIVTLLKSPALVRNFGRSARSKAIQKFDTTIVAQESLVFYQSLIH